MCVCVGGGVLEFSEMGGYPNWGGGVLKWGGGLNPYTKYAGSQHMHTR